MDGNPCDFPACECRYCPNEIRAIIGAWEALPASLSVGEEKPAEPKREWRPPLFLDQAG
jgi:hypothetical protein